MEQLIAEVCPGQAEVISPLGLLQPKRARRRGRSLDGAWLSCRGTRESSCGETREQKRRREEDS